MSLSLPGCASLRLDHDTAEPGLVGVAGDAVDPAVVAVIGLAGVGKAGDIAAVESFVGEDESTAISGTCAAGASSADMARIAGLRLQRRGADRAGLAHAVAASISRSASGRRSLPEIRRGRSASRNWLRLAACTWIVSIRERRAPASTSHAWINSGGGITTGWRYALLRLRPGTAASVFRPSRPARCKAK